MGTVDKQLPCETCNCNFENCPGHFGHIELVMPVYHIGFLEECKKILRCICFNCSKCLLPDDKKYNEIRNIQNPKKRQAYNRQLAQQTVSVEAYNKLYNENKNLQNYCAKSVEI